jgi:hypothetical protein
VTSPSSRPILALAARYLLGGLLLWAAVSKLANPTAFLGSLYAYDLPLPAALLKVVAVVLPWLELLCGLLLLANAWPQTTLLFVAGLFGVFVVATAQAAGRGLEIACGCFDLKILGFAEVATGTVHFLESPGFALVRNLALLAAAVWLLRLTPVTGLVPELPANPTLDRAREAGSHPGKPASKHARRHQRR